MIAARLGYDGFIKCFAYQAIDWVRVKLLSPHGLSPEANTRGGILGVPAHK